MVYLKVDYSEFQLQITPPPLADSVPLTDAIYLFCFLFMITLNKTIKGLALGSQPKLTS